MSVPGARPDLVVFSHLRWDWVWQRPQQLVTRLARRRAPTGARTYFVEEPVTGPVSEGVLSRVEIDMVTVLRLVLPTAPGRPEFLGFEHPAAADYGVLIAEFLAEQDRPGGPDTWLFTPMALGQARSLPGGKLIYDVMDDLTAFHGAAAEMGEQHRLALAEADVVFTGGRSLHRAVLHHRERAVHLFRSGVDRNHYRSAVDRRPDRRAIPVAGYLGVVDERMDLTLLAELAERLPEWLLRLVGPVTKIDPSSLPNAANIDYVGMTSYDELPGVLAGFDVAIMPFAANRATASISPTKTLEYLAAGLPVVSTPIPDVVADFGDAVSIARDADQFAAGCRSGLRQERLRRGRRSDLALLGGEQLAEQQDVWVGQEWDDIAAAMDSLV